MHIREEGEQDRASVRAVNLLAFETSAEADLVDAVREAARPLVSLVAEVQGDVVGHILFSPVTIDGHPAVQMMGLAPMAVAPAHQRVGIGSALVRAGLLACADVGTNAVVVLGHPAYYPRFGFIPASRYGLGTSYDVPDDVFLVKELTPGALAGVAGTVRYHPAFREV